MDVWVMTIHPLKLPQLPAWIRSRLLIGFCFLTFSSISGANQEHNRSQLVAISSRRPGAHASPVAHTFDDLNYLNLNHQQPPLMIWNIWIWIVIIWIVCSWTDGKNTVTQILHAVFLYPDPFVSRSCMQFSVRWSVHHQSAHCSLFVITELIMLV